MDPVVQDHHSFSQTHKINEIPVFYTCPSKSHHYKNKTLLSYIDEVILHYDLGQWIWHIDSNGFEFTLDGQQFSSLVKNIVEKYSEELQQINIIKPNWYMHSVLKILWPFLSKNTQKMIVIVNVDPYPFDDIDF